MPGIFGVVGEQSEVYSALARFYGSVWPRVEERTLPGARVGAHAYHGEALSAAPDGSVVGVDGVSRAYRGSVGSRGDVSVCGSSARFTPDGAVRLVSDETGAFPLYYVQLAEGLAFSSLLEPLARAVGASVNPVGVATFLRFGFCIGDQTPFKEIWRVQPGQVVTFRVESGLDREDRSRAWVGVDEALWTPDAAAEAARDLLLDSLRPLDEERGRSRLMMSAGWDSRTLLAGAHAGGIADRLHGYSHGDPRSRELRIARHLCSAVDIPWRSRPIGGEVWNLEHLDRTFARTGSLIFPHWGWSSRKGSDIRCIVSGVLGEVLGGHYGETQVREGRGKVVALLRGFQTTDTAADALRDPGEVVDEVTRVLSPREMGQPWYLAPDAESDPTFLREVVSEAIRDQLVRLVDRGVARREHLIEAFVTEHRGAQYICAQALSARVGADAAIPFGNPALFRFATRIPPHVKIHNRVNRALIRLLAPELERFPMAATLVPAHWPLLAQEASRAVRKIYEEGRWALHRWSGRRAGPPRLGWVDFEFLRGSDVLEEVVDSLRADLWDRGALNDMVARVREGLDGRQLHPLFDQLGKILTVDRLITGRSR